MKPVGLVAGSSGRLFCRGDVVAFVERADAPLLKTISAARPDQVLANVLDHVRTRPDSPPAFVIIDRSSATLVLHGQLPLRSGETQFACDDNSPTNLVWNREHELRLDPSGTGNAPLTFLRDGCVPADGFVVKPEPVQRGADRPAHVPDSQPPAPKRRMPPSVLDDPGIDLAAIGKKEVAPAVPRTTADPAAASAALDRDISESTTDAVIANDDEADPKPSPRPSRQFRPPPTISAKQPAEAHAVSPTEEDTASPSRAVVRFADGQAHNFSTGLLIGRYPEKNGVPDGYVTVTVTGDEVSRIHVELRVENGQLFGRDCGTPNGSALRSNRGLTDLELSEPGSPLEPGDVIEFGGQRIFFDGWSTDG